jgi:4'-phosphopantetheinyl transferase
MGMVSIQKFDSDSFIGLWHITESLEELLLTADLTADEQLELEKKASTKKKKEWLACKNLIKLMSGNAMAIGNDLNGKPFDKTGQYHVSISHSAHYASVYLSSSGPVGTDIQILKSTISAGADFFLNEDELEWVDIENNELLHLIWSAKESAFKYAGQNDLNFKKDISINRFEGNQNDIIEVTISSRQTIVKIGIAYSFFDGYVLTRTI